jgi:hypothetical protein
MKTKNDRTGKKKRKKKTKERRKKYETTVQATSQQTPGSSNARQLWVFLLHLRSRVGLYTILGDGRHTTMRIPKSGGISMLDNHIDSPCLHPIPT